MADSIANPRLDRINKTIEAQKAFLHRIPDPDTRERAEANLHCLIDMRDDAIALLGSASSER